MGKVGNEFGRHDFLPFETRVVPAWPDPFRRRGDTVIKDLARRSESGRLLSAANSLARIHRWNAVKGEPKSTQNGIGVTF